MNRKDCESIISAVPSVEAAIIMGGNGLPLAWHTRYDVQIDEITSICAGCMSIAGELHLFDPSSNSSMLFETQFGALSIRTIGLDTVLVLCIAGDYSLLTIDRILEGIVSDSNS